jgi:hypothetical protein
MHAPTRTPSLGRDVYPCTGSDQQKQNGGENGRLAAELAVAVDTATGLSTQGTSTAGRSAPKATVRADQIGGGPPERTGDESGQRAGGRDKAETEAVW